MAKLSIRDLDLKGKRVFIRVDFNVPISDGQVTSDKRIRESLPTIQYALEQGAGVILASHLGRPKGKPDPKYSLQPVARRLEELLGRPVKFAPDCVGPEVEALKPAPGEVLLLENVRFHEEETKNDPEFARQLASLADVFVLDAFGSAHRAHASVWVLPSTCRRRPASCSKRSLNTWERRSPIRSGRQLPSWAAPRFRTRSR